MNSTYSFVINFYFLLLKVVSLFNVKAKLWIDGRKQWREKLSNNINSDDEWIWVHCSSLGEYEDCAEVISGIRSTYTFSKVILTFFSPTGIEATRGKEIANYITYLPLDTKSNAERFLNLINPKFILFSRSELWYNFLSEIVKRKIPTFLISALVSPTSGFIKWPQKIVYKKCYNAFTQIYCQNNQTKNLLEKYFNNNKCTVSGNSRIDRIHKSHTDKEFNKVSQFVGNSFCVVAGSCLDIDEKMILSTIEKLKHLKIKWIIVPHEINEKKINQQLILHKSTFIKYSNLNSLTNNHSVLYVDFIGSLKHLYKYSNLAVIGGGFNKIGIHNIIEPAFHGLPTTFGPNHKDYPEALELLDLNFSSIHQNQPELQEIIERFYNNPINVKTKNDIKQYVLSNTGASKSIVSEISYRLKELA